MGIDIDQARARHFQDMQQALEDGLRAIESARTPGEADAARQRTKLRLEDLNRRWAETTAGACAPQTTGPTTATMW